MKSTETIVVNMYNEFGEVIDVLYRGTSYEKANYAMCEKLRDLLRFAEGRSGYCNRAEKRRWSAEAKYLRNYLRKFEAREPGKRTGANITLEGGHFALIMQVEY